MTGQRFKLTIAFDGTAYHGWHAGRSGRGMVDHIQKALAVLLPSAPQLCSSSRTDSGVHALGLVAHFDVPENEAALPARRFTRDSAQLRNNTAIRSVTRRS